MASPAKTVQARGAEYVPIHGKREVVIYPIQEHELKTIGICNTQVALWSSVASACLSLIAACVWNMETSREVQESRFAWPFISFCAIIAIIAAVLAVYYYKARNSEIEQIKSEVKH